jgi:hypothetical protein
MENTVKIAISALLTNDEVKILSDSKWYQEELVTFENWQELREANTQSRPDYIRQVYEWIIIADATRVFTEYRTKQIKEQIALTEQVVRDWVTSSITSTIE